MFIRRIGGVVSFVVFVVEDGLGERAKKNSFHTRKKNSLYTSRSDCNGRILGKRKPFRVKQKVFLNEMSAPNAME
jgi:hypothetical protein